MYYLQSRYYNPEWGRFINFDNYGGSVGELNSHNGYAYCKNNPVNMVDYEGNLGLALISLTALIVGLIIVATMPPETSQRMGEAIVELGNTIGIAVEQTWNSVVKSTTKATTKTKATTDVITKTKTKKKDDTVIYRYGGSNPGNLTPRLIDKKTGVSFTTIPPIVGSVKTTIGAINSTGLLYAVQDTPTHVSVKPIGGTIEEWQAIGPTSKWTIALKSVVIKWSGVN